MNKERVVKSIIISLFICMFFIACAKPSSIKAMDNQKTNQKVYKWKLAQTWGANFPIFSDIPKNMAKMVKSMSNGRLIIDIDPSNIHKAPFGIFDFVKSGNYQMGHAASYYWKGKDFNTLFFTTVPFGMIAIEQYAWFYYGGGMELMKELYSKHGLLSYPGGNTGNQPGGWFKKEINTLEDFKNVKMRIPGFAGEVLSKIGAKTVNIPPGELYQALDRGVIDALEWVGPAHDLPMGFHKIANYYYTGWHEPATELQFLINKKAFDKLPADLQQILITAVRLSAYDMLSQSMHENGINWEKIKKDYPNVKIKTFSPDIIAKLKEVTKQLLKEHAAKDPMGKKIIDSKQAYLKKVRKWTEISDYAYLKGN